MRLVFPCFLLTCVFSCFTFAESAPPAGITLHPAVEWGSTMPAGPFVRLANGGILGVAEDAALISPDEGITWERSPLPEGLKISGERALLRTANGAIVLVFLNMVDYHWAWNAEKSLPEPDTRLDVWSVRSLDDGKTWTDAQMIYDGYSGDIHHMIQTRSGRIVAPVQILMYEEGRHALQPRYSHDDGKTWQRSNLLDIGGRGHHDGLIEATLTQLADDRVWMLCRTNLGRFWSAYSDNNGEDFRVLGPSNIEASSAPGTFTRLQSGRLMLSWNRPVPEGQSEPPAGVMQGGDRQWSDVRVSNYRAEVSVAFSEDDGQSWTKPVVVAKATQSTASLAYLYVFEQAPGSLWLSSMQGDLRLKFKEEALLQAAAQ